jgi:hypothetical protein
MQATQEAKAPSFWCLVVCFRSESGARDYDRETMPFVSVLVRASYSSGDENNTLSKTDNGDFVFQPEFRTERYLTETLVNRSLILMNARAMLDNLGAGRPLTAVERQAFVAIYRESATPIVRPKHGRLPGRQTVLEISSEVGQT